MADIADRADLTDEPQGGAGANPAPQQADLPPPVVLPSPPNIPPQDHGTMPPAPAPMQPGPPAPAPMQQGPPDAAPMQQGPQPAAPMQPGPQPAMPMQPGPPDGTMYLPLVPVQAPKDWWRAAAVALMNLSGLGIGYVLMRRWKAAVGTWIATALFLLIILPATSGGIPIGVIVLYLAFLAAVGVHGGVRALRTPLSWPPRSLLAFGIAVVLLVVPVGGAVLYSDAHQEAIQQMLLKRLATADASIAAAQSEPIATAAADFAPGLGTYQDLLDHHRTSRAGKLVPARLAAFYQNVSAPYTKHDYCDAIEPLTYLRGLPSGTLSAQDLGALAAFPDDPLATSLLQCGTGYLSGSSASLADAVKDLNLLMVTFPNSGQAAQVEPAVAKALGAVAGGITGADPCTATDNVTKLGTQIKNLTSSVAAITAALQKDAATATSDVESGTYNCAVSKYKAGNFSDAQSAFDSFATTYPDDPNKALAQKYSIAAEIAQQLAGAGKVTPTLTSGGSVSITVYNDSPNPMQILYTGPATGTINIAACSSCKTYANTSDAQQNACGNSSTDYPKASFSLPPGTTYFLQKSTGVSARAYAHSESYDADSEYEVCAYQTDLLGLPPVTAPVPSL